MCDTTDTNENAYSPNECDCTREEVPDHFGTGYFLGMISTLMFVALGLAIFFCAHPEKHTGKVRVISSNHGHILFERPNHEQFVMVLDDSSIGFDGVFEDITYTDVSATKRRLVKAMPYINPPLPPLPLEWTIKNSAEYKLTAPSAAVVR